MQTCIIICTGRPEEDTAEACSPQAAQSLKNFDARIDVRVMRIMRGIKSRASHATVTPLFH